MAEDLDGAQAFADDDQDRIAGLDMDWQFAQPRAPTHVIKVLEREAKYELRHRGEILT